MKKKLFSILLSLAMVVTMMSMATMTALADPITHDLTVTKNDGTDATEGTDYRWDGDELEIIKDGLTVSGNTTDETIEVLISATNLTIKDLSIDVKETRKKPVYFANNNVCMTVKGENTLSSSENSIICSSCTITGDGTITASSRNQDQGAICATGTLTLDCSGTIKADSEKEYAISSATEIVVTENTGKIIAYSGSNHGALVSKSMLVDESLVMTGSADYKVDETNITGEAAFVPAAWGVKTGDKIAKSVLIRNNKVATPTASVAAGTYKSAQSVTLNTDTEGADIYYTTDGTAPTKESGTKYTEAITVDSTKTIKAIAVKEGCTDSEVFEATYTITPTPTPAPEPDPDPINYKVIEGANSVWDIAASENPVFRSNAPFEKFSHVLLDGKELAKKYYKAESGSTLITLTPEFTATLAVGKHTIEIVSTDGSASTVFYIEETIANTDGEGFALSTAAMSSALIGCNIVGLAVVFFELKKKKKVR